MKDTKSFYSKVMKDLSIHGYRFMGLQIFVCYEETVEFDKVKAGPIGPIVPQIIYEYGVAIVPW